MSRVASALVGCLVCAGLGEAGPARAADASAEGELLVLAASSLGDVLERLARDFEAAHPGTQVRLSLAGSQKLRAQIEQGIVADLFVSADEGNMVRLYRQELVTSPVLVARNRPALITSPDSPVRSFADLPQAQRIVLGAAEVPVGAYALEIIRAAERRYGAGFRAAVEERIVSRELSVRHVLTRVILGEGDAGIVYASDAVAAGDKGRMVAIPADLDVIARYPAAVLRAARRPDMARAFLTLLVSSHGQERFRSAGFLSAQAEVSP